MAGVMIAPVSLAVQHEQFLSRGNVARCFHAGCKRVRDSLDAVESNGRTLYGFEANEV